MDTWIRVANMAELMPEGLGTGVKADGIRIALFQWEGKIYAVEDLCPHLGFPLSEGLVQEGEVICGWHGWLKRGKTHYAPVNGVRELREAIAYWLSGRYKTSVDPACVLVSPGAKVMIFAIIHSLVDPGDEVIYAADDNAVGLAHKFEKRFTRDLVVNDGVDRSRSFQQLNAGWIDPIQ